MAGSDDSTRRRLAVLRSLELFRPLTERRLERVAEALIRLAFPDGAVIVEEGDDPEYFYIVVDGQVEVTRHGRWIATHGAGGHFCEAALLRGVPDDVAVVARAPVLLYALDAEGFADAVLSNRASWETASELIAARRDFGDRGEASVRDAAAHSPLPRRQDAPSARSSESHR